MTRVRILQVFGGLNRGGAETMVMNLYRNIDRDKIQFDFVTHQNYEGDYEDEIKKMGGRIFRVPKYKVINHLRYINARKKLLREHPEWKIIHGHMYTIASIYLKVANNEDRLTIAHSHNTSNGKGLKSIVKTIIEKPIASVADRFMACSNEAGRWLFGEDIVNSDIYTMIPNAIDVNSFKLNEGKRQKSREDLYLNGKIVIGHIARYNYQKNFPFLIKFVEELSKRNSNYVLLQIGDGKNHEELQRKIKEKSLEKNFISLGVRKDIPDLMQAMDIFILPSLFEGLPVTVVEAQASGLPCLLSDRVTEDVNLTKSIEYLPIDQGVSIWVNKVLNMSKERKLDAPDKVRKAGYDISYTADMIQEYYLNLIN